MRFEPELQVRKKVFGLFQVRLEVIRNSESLGMSIVRAIDHRKLFDQRAPRAHLQDAEVSMPTTEFFGRDPKSPFVRRGFSCAIRRHGLFKLRLKLGHRNHDLPEPNILSIEL